MSLLDRKCVVRAVAACGLLAVAAAAEAGGVPEPSGLWPGPMHASTPAALQGATVVDAKQLATIVEKDHPAMIDVSNLQRKPQGLAPGTLWSPTHRSIPTASWWPGGGEPTDDPKFADAFAAQAAKLTGGDKDKPIVTFCHPNRWGSWNAGKRLVKLGYTHVYWYPGGAEGWADSGQRLIETKPASIFKVDHPAPAEAPPPKAAQR